MIANPVDGACYWCILPSDESASYGDTAPREPWRGKLRIAERAGGTAMELSRVDEAGVADGDTNATAQVKPADLFATEIEAWHWCADAMRRHGHSLVADGLDFIVRAAVRHGAAVRQWEEGAKQGESRE